MQVNRAQEIPVNVVGSSTFGRYPKISVEKTYNMFISDEWLVNYAGFLKIAEVLASGEGRGLFHSIRGNFMIGVFSSAVYRFGLSIAPQFIGNIDTSSGEVIIDENLNQQIAIADGADLWIYSYNTGNLTKQNLTFLGNPVRPNYVTYHNTFFLIASNPTSDNAQNWYAAENATNDTITIAAENSFPLQTKPDNAIAVKRLPGRGNNVIVFGSSVAEIWTQVGGTENYRRVQSANIDNGCVSVSTIAANEEFVCWLAQNENNSPVIMATNGADSKRISSDGIDFLLQSLNRPDRSTAFFYRQDGHLFYQITFFDERDNLSLIYDFTTDKFFHVSDEDLNYHPARQIVFFNEKTYFASLNDANIYQMGTQFISYNYSGDALAEGDVIPRIRLCKTIRRENNERFRIGKFTFWIEQGVNDFFLLNADSGRFCDGLLITQDGLDFIVAQDGSLLLAQDGECLENLNRPRVDFSFSKNGNQSFSNIVSRNLNPEGKYRNEINWHRMGQANEFTPQLRFWGLQRFVAQNGVLEVY